MSEMALRRSWGLPSLAYYRLYTLDVSGHVIDVRDFEAEGDLAAIVEADVGMASGIKRELWNQGRRVLEFPPQIAEH